MSKFKIWEINIIKFILFITIFYLCKVYPLSLADLLRVAKNKYTLSETLSIAIKPCISSTSSLLNSKPWTKTNNQKLESGEFNHQEVKGSFPRISLAEKN